MEQGNCGEMPEKPKLLICPQISRWSNYSDQANGAHYSEIARLKSLPLLLNNGVQIHFFFAHIVFLVQVLAVTIRVIDFKFDL